MRNRNRKLGILIASVLGLCLLLYLGGLVGQLMENYEGWLNNDDYISFDTIRLLPWECIRTTFSFSGLKGMGIVVVFALLAFLYIKFSKKGGYVDDRNFQKSKLDTYGTASWMRDEVIQKYLEVSDVKKADGIILGMMNGKAVCLPKNTMLNKHIMAFGSSGSMKTRSVIRPAIYQALRRNESIVLLDPKSELYHDTANLFRESDYEVRVLNLKDPKYSDSWNAMADLDGDTLMAQILTDVTIKNTSSGKPDHFWDNGEANLLKALVLLTSTDPSRPDSRKNLPEVYRLITSVSEQQLESMFDRLPIEHPAKAPYTLFRRASESVRAGIISGLGTRLQVLQSGAVSNILSENEIDLTAPGRRKCAYYIVVSDQQGSLDFLTALFFSMLFIKLVNYADSREDMRCEIPVNVILEELNNCGTIPEFGRKISTGRSRLINCILVAQSLPQLQNRYPNNEWSELLGNCDTQLLLGATEEITANYFSFRSGVMSVAVNSTMTQRKTLALTQMVPEYRESAGVGKRPLQNPDEILRMPQDTVLVALRGQQVLRLKKFDYIHHPYADRAKPANIYQYRNRTVTESKSKQKETKNEKSPIATKKKEVKPLYTAAEPPDDF